MSAEPVVHADERYGRIIVGISFAVLGVVGGIVFYSTSAYIDALVSQRGFSLTAASTGPTFSSLTGGLGGLLAARLLTTVSTRSMFLTGSAGLGLSLAGIGLSQSSWQLWMCFAASGFFGALASGVPVSALVARWFPAGPAKPLTIAMTGMALGGAIFPPIVLIMLERFGVAKGSIMLGIGLVVLVWPAAAFVREPPVAALAAAASASVSAARASVRDRLFILMFGGLFCLFLSQAATTNHLVRLAKENDTHVAALAVTVMAVGALTGRLAGIPIMPAIGLRWLALSVAVTQAAGQLILSGAYHAWSLLLGAFLLGFAMGNVAILQSLFALEAYGVREYARMFSRITLTLPLAGGLGPLLTAELHNAFGGYRWALVVMAMFSVLGGIVLLWTGIDSDSRRSRRLVALVPTA